MVGQYSSLSAHGISASASWPLCRIMTLDSIIEKGWRELPRINRDKNDYR